MRGVGCLAAALIQIAVSGAHRCGAQTASDSIARGLDSVSLAARYGAVTTLENLPTSQISPAVRTRLITLLESEGEMLLQNATAPTPADTTDSGEQYPEYLGDLTQLVLRFQDLSSLRGLCLAGLQINGAVQQFVVSHADEALPFLREAWQNSALHEGVLETWGRLLGTPTAPISVAQRDSVIANVMAASATDSLGFVWAADLSGMAILAPAVAYVGSTSTDAVTRDRAADVQSSLAQSQAALTADEILVQTAAWLDGMCTGSTGPRHGACQSIGKFLTNAQKALGHPGQAARVELGNAIEHATTARDSGLFTPVEAAVIIGNATVVLARL